MQQPRIGDRGAGVQSSTLLALSAEGILPKVDYAIFADTGWEPEAVYAHLNRLEKEIAKPAGIPVLRVSSRNIRSDALNPDHRFASMPLRGPRVQHFRRAVEGEPEGRIGSLDCSTSSCSLGGGDQAPGRRSPLPS